MTSKPGRLVAELHCHTVHSPDGLITYDGLVRTARRRGIDVVCITDHDTIDGALEFQARARTESGAPHIVIGEERTLDDGSHLVGLFLRAPIAATRLAEAAAEIHQQGGMVLMPHPFRRKDGLLRAVAQPTSDELRGIDAFEIFNAKGSFGDNERARSLLPMTVGVFGGSDAHYESDMGQCVCDLPVSGSVEDSLRAMLRREVPFSVKGIRKVPGSGERQYAPLYYRIRPFVRLPKVLLPAAKQMYRFYRNKIRESSPPVLEEIYRHA
jgi:predicted metal-dependent phosphoesterase TrpH